MTYSINYKPLLTAKTKNLKFSKLIFCKNFFLFFLLLEKFTYKHNEALVSSSFIVRKENKFTKSFLRSPNRYKNAQIQIELLRYRVTFKQTYLYNLNLVQIMFSTINLLYFINFCFNSVLFIESTLFFLNKKKIKLVLLSDFYKKGILNYNF